MSIVGNSENTEECKETNNIGPDFSVCDLGPDSKLIWVWIIPVQLFLWRTTKKNLFDYILRYFTISHFKAVKWEKRKIYLLLIVTDESLENCWIGESKLTIFPNAWHY